MPQGIAAETPWACRPPPVAEGRAPGLDGERVGAKPPTRVTGPAPAGARTPPYTAPMRWDAPGGDWVSDDRSLIDVALVHHWLSRLSYWAQGRSLELVARSVEHSLCLGLYDAGGRQLGVCRWVTDYATFAWLCDVFVDPDARGGGRGTFLVATAASHPAVAGLRLQLLGTRDAHTLYQRFGFVEVPDPERLMERRP